MPAKPINAKALLRLHSQMEEVISSPRGHAGKPEPPAISGLRWSQHLNDGSIAELNLNSGSAQCLIRREQHISLKSFRCLHRRRWGWWGCSRPIARKML